MQRKRRNGAAEIRVWQSCSSSEPTYLFLCVIYDFVTLSSVCWLFNVSIGWIRVLPLSMLLHVFCCGFVSFIFYLFIYLFFAWCKREKKNSKLTINGLDLPLSTPTQPPPPPPPPPPSIHPSIHVLRVEPLEEFCHCIWKKVSFFCVFCHSWQFFLRIQFFFQEPSPLSLSLSLVVSCLFTGADRPN